jgi:hypothetical protein
MFYNRDLLRKLTGLEEPPDEYRAFLQVCETIRSQTNELGKFYIPVAGSGYHFGMMGGLMWESLTYLATTKADFNRDGSVGGDEQYVAFRTGRLDFDFPAYRARFKMIEEMSRNFQIRLHRADPRRGGVPVRPAEGGVHVHRHLGRAQFAGAGQGPV